MQSFQAPANREGREANRWLTIARRGSRTTDWGRRGQTPTPWLGSRAGTGGDGLTLSGDPLRPRRPHLCVRAAMLRIARMDLFSFLILLIMASFTLSSAGLLVGLVVVERQPKPSVSDPRRSSSRRRARKGKRADR
jgi:hypothetical protein